MNESVAMTTNRYGNVDQMNRLNNGRDSDSK